MSSNWNEGYFTDSTYTYGYYKDLSPAFQRFCLLIHGAIPPEHKETFNYCELGFGQGVSLNIHAVANPGHFFGNDFNPAQVSYAEGLNSQAGSPAHLYNDSFAEFLQRDDLPQFDSINLHGIWTWINRKNQHIIIDFVRRFLKPGGTLYVSYNCLPGWSPYVPLRGLLYFYDHFNHKKDDTSARVHADLKFAQDLLATHTDYEKHVPNFVKRLKELTRHDPHYLAHEYLNQEWNPMYFADVAEMLSDAQLDFAGTADLQEIIDTINSISGEKLNFLNSIANPIFREQVKDYFINTPFRKDLYVRGLRRPTELGKWQKILQTRFCLHHRATLPHFIENQMGQVAFKKEIYGSILEYLAEDNYAPKCFDVYLARHPKLSYLSFELILTMLVDIDCVMPCQPEEYVEKVRPRCNALNAYLLKENKYSFNTITFLACPETGAGFELQDFEQIYTLLILENSDYTAKELARKTWEIYQRQNKRVLKDGQLLETAEQNISELKNRAKHYLTYTLPILKAVKILP